MADLNQMITQSLFRINPQLRPITLEERLSEALLNSGKSKQWQQNQMAMSKDANRAGLPTFIPTQEDSAARLRLKDAIARSHASGFKFPYFIGTPTEPTGDRGVTMDVESLVSSLKSQEAIAAKKGDKAALDRLSKERAFWEKEASEGMTAQEWKSQTGQPDPIYPR